MKRCRLNHCNWISRTLNAIQQTLIATNKRRIRQASAWSDRLMSADGVVIARGAAPVSDPWRMGIPRQLIGVEGFEDAAATAWSVGSRAAGLGQLARSAEAF